MFSARGMPTLPRGASCAEIPSRSNSKCSLNSYKLGTLPALLVSPAPFSQRLPVMKRRCLPVAGSTPKSLMVSKHAFEQRLQRTVLWLGASALISSMVSIEVWGEDAAALEDAAPSAASVARSEDSGASDSVAPRPWRASLREVEGEAEGEVPEFARSLASKAAP